MVFYSGYLGHIRGVYVGCRRVPLKVRSKGGPIQNGLVIGFRGLGFLQGYLLKGPTRPVN